ncbi:hypothetical protein PPYR_11069 [Photinus pyralis]|uniref:LRRCT domain-containing protein n=1 Tax=Photinus pyralis TaxID=7054 RepID=A0A1Y1L5P7_PHOPY|nr:toll-like receptor Tollo [Photinus pyralis]XP_031348728.1 toll-like receptor Tollo [Photinus pyralis]KAB0797008.1 hypothetical protein PPYR_11069 [Photinus pyralis]
MRLALFLAQLVLAFEVAWTACTTENPYGVYNVYCTKITSFDDVPLEFRIPSVFDLFINGSTISLKRTKSLQGIANLHIHSSDITSLEPEFFDSASSLRELKIENCTVSNIQPFPVAKLSFLRVYNSKIGATPNKLLHNLKDLVLFTTSGNAWPSLTNFPDNFFKDLPLSVITLENADIYSLQGLSFKTLKKLHYLELQNNQLSSLPANLFQDLSELVNLNLSHNDFRKFDEKAFKGLPVLKTLSLAHNKLGDASKTWFTPLRSLLALDLSYNNIWKCDLILKNLTILNLSYNNFSKIASEAFVGLPKLSELDLSHNSIQNLSLQAFKGLTELRVLKLGHNKLQVIDGRVFGHFRSLNVLSMEYNQITNVSQAGFDSLKTLWNLDLTGNKLTRLGNIFHKISTLEELHLSNTSLVSLDSGSFQGLTRLQKLDLSQNSLRSIPGGVFQNLDSLEELNLSKVGFTKLDAATFGKLDMLLRLNLEGNALEELPLGIFDGVKLESLSLKGNLIKNISRNVLERQTKLKEINFENTPIYDLNATDVLPNLRYLLLNGTKYESHGVVDLKSRQFHKTSRGIWESTCSFPYC